jgi:preprotein translocase subunit SecD
MKNFYANLFAFLLLWVASLGIVFYKPVNLGLDLRGGVSILLQPDLSYALEQEYQRLSKDLYDKLREEKVPVLDALAGKEGIKVELLEDTKIEQVIQKHFPRLEIKERGKGYVLIALKEQEISVLREGIISQTIEVLVIQPVITKVGQDRVLVELPGLLDLERAKSVIGKTALLELKLVVDAGSKEHLEKRLTPDLELLPSRDNTQWFLVEKTAVITGADLKTAYTSQDEFGNRAWLQANFERSF